MHRVTNATNAYTLFYIHSLFLSFQNTFVDIFKFPPKSTTQCFCMCCYYEVCFSYISSYIILKISIQYSKKRACPYMIQLKHACHVHVNPIKKWAK